MNQFWTWTDTCTDYAGPMYKVMIKFSMDMEGQKDVQNELKDVEFQMRKLAQSPAAHDVKTAFQTWAATENGQKAHKMVNDFFTSSEWNSVVAELDDVSDLLEKSVKATQTEISLDNSVIPKLDKELNDVDSALNQAEQKWGKKINDL